jgi:hypothetical protein
MMSVRTAILLPLVAASAFGQDSATVDQSSRQMDDMARRLEALERRNAELQSQVTELRAQTGEQWLTEERAAEVRSLVQDILADSATRTSLQSTSATAGWDNGFFIASADNRFRLNVGGLVQARFVWSALGSTYVAPSRLTNPVRFDTVQNQYGFDVQNVELWGSGHILSPDIQYMVKALVSQNQDVGIQMVGNGANQTSPQPSLVSGSNSGNFQLLDAWVRLNLTDEWSFRMGQFRAPYGREFLVLEQYQMAVDRSLVSLHYGMGYTQGIELEYLSNEARWRISLNDGGTDNIVAPAQVVGSRPLNSPWDAQTASFGVTTRFDWKGEGSWSQFDQFTSPEGTEQGWLVGVALNAQSTKPETGNPIPPAATGEISHSNTWLGVTADATFQFGGASLFASVYYNYVTSNAAYFVQNVSGTTSSNAGNVNALGFVVQPSVYLAPKWEAFSRYEYMHTTASQSGNSPIIDSLLGNYLFQQRHMSLLTTGFNYYIDGQDLKFTTDFGVAFNPVYPSYAAPETGWRASGGDEFVLRAQLQLMF